MATMNQLWAWEYEGKTEVGEQFKRGHDELCRTFNNKERYRLIVTNLRKVKMVDEDAVVIDLKKIPDARLKAQNTHWILRNQEYEASLIGEVLNQLTPPVTEPKNFGAIVEANYPKVGIGRRHKFVRNGRDWICENTLYNFDWSDLINPSIISEGVEG